MSDTVVRWGILGPGSIAHSFARGVAQSEGAKLMAVGSRNIERARKFAADHAIPKAHGSYDALVVDGDVDAIYVATPHSFHRAHSLLALNAGKHVVCEKPFTINEAELREVVETARARRLFLMEAMWTRFFPVMAQARELVRDGAIGEVRLIQADFGFRAEVNPQGRLFNPSLGGGGLLDVGVYPLSFISMLLGEPNRIAGMATLGQTGVDEQAAVVLGFSGGRLASLTTGVRTTTPHEAHVLGSDGRIHIPASWWMPRKLILHRQGKEPETIAPETSDCGYVYEAAEASSCIRAGKLESEIMPLDESLAIMRTMDTIRAQWGLRYPMEA